MGARWFDPYLGRFISADSIIPGPGNPTAYDRYQYANNNPIRFSDPTGHISCESSFVAEGDCSNMTTLEILEDLYGVVLTTAEGFEGFWTPEKVSAVYDAVRAVGSAFAGEMSGVVTSDAAFRKIYRTNEIDKMTLEYDPRCPECRTAAQNANPVCTNNFTGDCAASGAFTHSYRRIQFASMASLDRANHRLRWTLHVVHELGHAFNGVMGNVPYSTFSPVFAGNALFQRQTGATDYSGFAEQYQIRTWQQSTTNSYGEVFADMFVGWTFGTWETNPDGSLSRAALAKSSWMTTNMGEWIR